MKGKILIEFDWKDKDLIFEAENKLLEAGVKFDTGTFVGDSESGRYIREWQVDDVGNKQIRLKGVSKE